MLQAILDVFILKVKMHGRNLNWMGENRLRSSCSMRVRDVLRRGINVPRRGIIVAGLLAGVLGPLGCQPEALLILLPEDGVEVPKQTPPFMLATGDTLQVYLLLGYNDVYSTGLMDLAAKMNSQGIPARWLSNADWPTLLSEIQESHAKGTLQGDLVFVGHSFGGDDAVNLARKLNALDIPVRLIVLVDGTSPAPIPPNVDYCYNLYKPTVAGALFPNSFAGNPIEAEPGNTHTVIINEPVTKETFGPDAVYMSHFTIDSEPLIHQAVIDKVREIEAMRISQKATAME